MRVPSIHGAMSSSTPSETRERFEALALAHLTAAYGVALRLTRHGEDARDLVQETYLRAFRTFVQFQPGTNCKAWLLTILYSIFVNRYRKKQREPAVIALESLDEQFKRLFPAEVREAEWRAWQAAGVDAASAEVRRALAELPESFRVAVLLVDAEGLTYEEAAAALQCPVGTVRSRLFRGRKLLYVALRDYARRSGYLAPGEGEHER